jgi:hypothetical protein
VVYLSNIGFYRIDIMDVTAWLARVRHDLVKRVLWPARDRREMGGTPVPGELSPHLINEEGVAITAAALWAALVAEARSGLEPAGQSLDGSALDTFTAALERAINAADAGNLEGVLALEPAFDELARSLAQSLAQSLEGKR